MPSERKPPWTPGPWRLKELVNNADEYKAQVCGDIFVLADIYGPPYEHQPANAHLIAAAPDMAEAAEEIERLFLVIESAVRLADPAKLTIVLDALNRNKCALSKARGETT